jgi:RNA polymerase sigma-70 factor (ECF subfamily)
VPFLTAIFVGIESPDGGDLLARARAGDTEAFCEICRVHQGRLLRQAMALCGDASLAEDLAQETLVEAWKSLRRFNGNCQFFTWLCAILLNRHRNIRRARRPVAFSALSAGDQDAAQGGYQSLADESIGPDEAALAGERAELVRSCLEALPEKQRRVVYLRFYSGDSLEGIATALGCSVGTVKSRLFTALDKLRSMKAFGRGTPAARPTVSNL